MAGHIVNITPRDIAPRAVWALEQAGIHPLLARLYAARGITQAQELDTALNKLLPPHTLLGAERAATLLADAIAQNKKICIVADYDCDGASACAIAVRGLRHLGAKSVNYLVPDRMIDGYGLTPPIAQRVKDSGADILVTVDNGIASVEGVAHAKALGLQALITDHHLPGDALPAADVIVNPNQAGCTFASKSIAGVGVMFYVLLALRTELRTRGVFDAHTQPKLDSLLPLVALGTVADVVRLDHNNRRLVAQGLKRIRANHLPAGMASLFAVSGRTCATASTFDLGFALGPRINAAGRLSDMTLGIECLLTDDPQRANELSQMLDNINQERRVIEGEMREQAMQIAENRLDPKAELPAAICIFDPDFHEGVVGIVAARLKDKMHRPTFVFAASQAPGKEHELKGSGRSISGFHLRDALDLVAKRHPGVLRRFGGHAMAAGCTILEENLDEFAQAFTEIARECLDASVLTHQLLTDGPLPPEYCCVDMAQALYQEVWGQGFTAPLFSEEIEVLSQRLVADKHLALQIKHQNQVVEGIWFGRTEALAKKMVLAFRLNTNEWKGTRRVQFVIEAGIEAHKH